MVFDSLSNDLGGFNEIITRNALDGVIEKSDVFCLLNHDKSKGVLASPVLWCQHLYQNKLAAKLAIHQTAL